MWGWGLRCLDWGVILSKQQGTRCDWSNHSLLLAQAAMSHSSVQNVIQKPAKTAAPSPATEVTYSLVAIPRMQVNSHVMCDWAKDNNPSLYIQDA